MLAFVRETERACFCLKHGTRDPDVIEQGAEIHDDGPSSPP